MPGGVPYVRRIKREASITQRLIGAQGATLGIKTSLDLYAKLQHDAARLAVNWGVYEAFDFVVTAWHLNEDWKTSEQPKAPCRIKRGKSQHPAEMALLLNVIRDLANGSKHFNLNPEAQGSRKITSTHVRREANWYAYFHHEDMPGLNVGTSVFSIRVLRNLVMAYFDWVFDDSRPAGAFPQEIVDTVRYCDVAQRQPPYEPPPLWTVGLSTSAVPGTKSS